MARIRTFLNFLLFLGVGLLPIYIYGSGNLQPTHAILLVFSLSAMLTHGFTPEKWNVAMMVLALYALIIEAAYSLGGGNPASMLNAVFFLYNFILAYGVWQFCRFNGVKMVAWGLVGAAVLGLMSIGFFGVDIVVRDYGIRETGGFNNPNQLGYFAVCLLSMSYLFSVRGLYSRAVTYLMYGISITLAIASLSKAAMVATFVVLFLASNPKMTRQFILPWTIAILLGLTVVTYMVTSGSMDDYLFAQRLSGMTEEKDSSLESRGYFAFLQASPFAAIVGLGTDQVVDILKHEVHSTIASVFNVLGFIGGGLFMTVLFLWAKHVYRSFGFVGVICVVGPPMIYGITHNGSRFAIFWILVAVSMLPWKRTVSADARTAPPIQVPQPRRAAAVRGTPAPGRRLVPNRRGAPAVRTAAGVPVENSGPAPMSRIHPSDSPN